jgi:hypothetical protein
MRVLFTISWDLAQDPFLTGESKVLTPDPRDVSINLT